MSIFISINLLGVSPPSSPLILSPHIHIFWPLRLTKCLSYLFMPFTSESDGEGDDPTKNLFIEVFTVNYTFSMWIKMSTRSPSLPLPLSLSHCFAVSFSVWRNHSYFIKLTDYGMAWLGFYTVSFWPETSWRCPCPALPVGFIAMQTAPNGCV